MAISTRAEKSIDIAGVRRLTHPGFGLICFTEE
jgi:hypothetical protein